MRQAHPLILPLRLVVVFIHILWLMVGNGLSLKIQLIIPILSVLLWGTTVYLRGKSLTREGRRRCIQDNLWLLLLYYLVLLAVILLFGGLFHVSRKWGGTVNLDLFHTVRSYWKLYQRTGNFESVSNLLGNVVVLMPLGVLLPVMFQPMRKAWRALLLLALVAIGVEVFQFLLGTGTADVDDSLFNFLGAWLAYALTRGVQMIIETRR